MIDQIEAVVRRLWPHGQVCAFGSFATGLYLPTRFDRVSARVTARAAAAAHMLRALEACACATRSDIDLVVLVKDQVSAVHVLRQLSGALREAGLVDTMQVIEKARVWCQGGAVEVSRPRPR